MKLFNIKSVFSCVLFVINPALSLIYSFYFFVKEKKAILILSLSLALLFIYFPIMGDTLANFYSVQNGNVRNIYNWLPYELKQNFDIDFFYIIYFYTFVIFYCWFKSISFIGQDVNYKNWIMLCLASIFLIIYRDVMDLHRIFLAFSLLFYYYFYIKQKAKQTILIQMICFAGFVGLAISIHSYSAIFILIYLGSFVSFIDKMSIKWGLLLIVVVLFLGVQSNSLLELISSKTHIIQSLYVSKSSAWGFDIKPFTSVLWKNKFIVLSLVLFIILAIKNEDKNKKQAMQFVVILSCLALFFLMYKTLFERTSILAMLFGIYSLTAYNKSNHLTYLKYFLLFILFLYFTILNFHQHGGIFSSDGHKSIMPNSALKMEMIHKPFHSFTFDLIQLGKNGYSNLYLEKNVPPFNIGSYMYKENLKRKSLLNDEKK